MQTLNIKTEWNPDFGCYISTDSQYPDIEAAGTSETEAVENLRSHINSFEEAKKENKLPKNKGGRPAKDNIKLSCNVPVKIKAFIDLMAFEKGVKQGTIIEEMVKFYQEKKNAPNATTFETPKRAVKKDKQVDGLAPNKRFNQRPKKDLA